MTLIPLPVVILPLIYSGSLFMSDMAARGSPQLATKRKNCNLSHDSGRTWENSKSKSPNKSCILTPVSVISWILVLLTED